VKTCICQGQCGRHKGPCPERSGRQSVLRANYCWLPTIHERSDGKVWCNICWRVEEQRLRQQRRAEKAEAEQQRAADAERQGRLFGAEKCQ
jgi:hypothetical protein